MGNNRGGQKKFIRVMFAPRDARDLREQYPELKEYEEFTSGISKEEVLLAWYYGVVYRSIEDPKSRMYKACADTYGESTSDEKVRKYIDGNYPVGVREAIKKFEGFVLTERMKGLQMVQKTIATYEEILNKDITDLVEAKEWKQIKDWQDLVSNINKEMPELIKKIEHGYGTAEVMIMGAEKPINSYYQRKVTQQVD